MFGEIRNPGGERLDHSFHSGADGARELVVIGHGVTANKDRAFLVALAEGLATAGVPALRFSFSGNGGSEGRFEESTVSKEVDDLGAVLDAAAAAGFASLVYAGHSMGGAVGVLRASADERIERLVSLAGMVDTAEFARRKFGDQEPGASFMWEKPECPLSQAYMDDMAAISSVADRAAAVRVPWLLVHGTDDTVVPIEDSHTARARAAGEVELFPIEGADHLFSGEACDAMVAKVVSWIGPPRTA